MLSPFFKAAPASQIEFYSGEDVAHQVLRLIKEAQDELVIVSPYLKLWRHAENALKAAAENDCRIVVLTRDPEQDEQQAYNLGVFCGTVESFGKIDVLTVPRLHTKLYLSETAAIVGSMNLYDSSAQNSLELIALLKDQTSLAWLGKEVKSLKAQASPVPRARSSRTPQSRTSSSRKGTCLRCGDSIALNSERPLCASCYREWERYWNPDYVESYCHGCGSRAETTMAKPLCRRCYKSL